MSKTILAARMRNLLDRRQSQDSLRQLRDHSRANLIDFSSNDYLGLARDADFIAEIHSRAQNLPRFGATRLGATGSRLLTGENYLAAQLENQIADFHQSEAALIFNSGYDANIGWLPTLARRSDIILYDAAIHASLHDAMQLSAAERVAFAHNDVADLAQQLAKIHDERKNTASKKDSLIFVLTESIYSMDGDLCPLAEIVELCEQYNAIIFVDEAHATGIIGQKGAGLVQKLGLENKIDFRLHTFGKALGGHGAALLCSHLSRNYFINYARSLIYTTALPFHSLLAAQAAYDYLATPQADAKREALTKNIHFFAQSAAAFSQLNICPQPSAIQYIPAQSNAHARQLSATLLQNGIDARPIVAPTVAQGQQRLRICLHAYNTTAEIELLISVVYSSTLSA
jgi:8-amino-7-oxononanoate synthase